MNLRNNLWKCTVLLSLLATSLSAAAGALEDYRVIDRQIDKEPQTAIDAVDRFENRYARGSQMEKTMAAYLRLRISLIMENWAAAMRSTETLIALKPNPEQRLGLLKLAAQVGYQLEDWNKTIQYAQDWLAAVGQTKQKTPEAASLYELKAFAENNLGKSATAVATMQIAFGIEATKNRGDFILSCWQSMQKTAEELRFLPVMIRQWPESVYWSRWGWLLYEENRQGEALNVLSAAEKTRKLDARLVPLLIDLLYSKEAYHELLRVLRANPEALPQRSMAMLQASALIQTGRRTQALDVLNAFVRTSEAKHSDIALAAQTAYAEEKWSRLRELADRLVKIEDQNREYWLILGGIACFELKDYTAAHQVFSEVQSDKWKETRRLWLNQIQFLQPEIVHHGHHAQP